MNWQRLESATIDPQLDEGLEARLADPAWLLARQWQAGEFRGDDAANPLLIEMESESVHIDRLTMKGGRQTVPVTAGTPVEPLVEREEVRDGPGGTRIAAELGLILLTALARLPAGRAVGESLRERASLRLPDDGLDPVGRRRLELLARRSLDGVALAAALDAEPGLLDTLLAELGLSEHDKDQTHKVVRVWRREAADAFHEPAGPRAWDPSRLEYSFDLRGSTEKGDVRLVAEQYAGGRLEWYHFDRADTRTATAPPSRLTTRRAEVLPVRLRFRGMPAVRFWAFEHGEVSFGAIDAGPQDLARAAVAGYMTVYADNWYVLPLQVRTATLTTVTSVRVLDDFGRWTTVPAAAVVDGGGDDRAFRFFELAGDPGPAAGTAPALFLPPSVETTDAGRPLEDVRFVRDEVANLAWALEQRIESAAGRAVDLVGRTPVEPPEPAGDGQWRLDLSTSVPAQWVPLVPVRLGQGGGIWLQRGRVPVPGGGSRGARGRILEPWRRLLIQEDEVLSTGVRVVRRYQSARGVDGRLHTWVGRRKGPGRGQGSSGLVFDHLETD
jgi:hypothetical protein